MKGKYFVKSGIFLIVIGLVLTSVKTVHGLVREYLDDVNLSREITTSINTNYDVFIDNIDRYKVNLEDLYGAYDIYLDEFTSSNPNITNNIAAVNVDLVELLNISKELKEACDYNGGGSRKTEKCEIFKTNFKSSVESYHKAIDEYNRIISLYNKRVLRKKKKTMDYYVSPIDKELIKLYDEL